MKMLATCAFVFLTTTTMVRADLSIRRTEGTVTAKGDHFALTVDLRRGGEIAALKLHDGARWNEVFRESAITFPALTLSDDNRVYALSKDDKATLTNVTATPEKIEIKTRAVPRAADGAAGPWQVDLAYEVYPEGAIFIDLDCRLEGQAFALSRSSVSFAVSEAIRKGPKYRDRNVSIKSGGFRSARVAFGLSGNPAHSFTNEIEAIVEHMKPIIGKASYQQKDGRVTWDLGGGETLKPSFRYQNRLALGLGSAVTGKPRSNVIGQRVYHWVNWLDKKNWYPTNAQIDKMVANHATMLVLHHEWMRQRGSNGYPHAEYDVVRNHEDMVRMIDYAHRRGLRVGLYMRGVEWYGLKAEFFQKYCKRNLDGIYVDWHGPAAVSWHEKRYAPETKLGDTHFSKKGTHVPARAYFFFTRKLRDIVGPKGFLIGHQGSFNSGVFANLCFDAYLPGETGSDRKMLSDLDEAAYKGMLGGGVCMPWTLDLPSYRNAEGAAKMAAWGFYPHLVMGIKARQTKNLTFSLDPDDDLYAFVLPYWRVLAKIDVDKATVFNLASQNVVALSSSEPGVQGVVYKEGDNAYLLVVANLGAKPARSTLTLDPKVLGMSGSYRVVRIEAATGKAHPCGESTGQVTTSELPQWGIEGFKLSKK